MNNTQGSRVIALGSSTYVRGNAAALAWVAALCAALFTFCIPADSHADVIFQTAATSTGEVQVFTPEGLHRWFGGTLDEPVVDLGTWNADDFTLDASSTIHLWLRWNGVYEPEFYLILRAAVGGDPFYGTGSTTTQVSYIPFADSYSRIENVTDAPELQQFTVPATPGQTIHHDDELWAFLYPSFAGYGANDWMAASGTMPVIQICEGDCTSSSSTPAAAPPSCSQDCYSNVLFIPGTEASRLYGTDGSGNEERLWEPDTSDDAEQLAFDANGASKRDDIYTRDVIGSAYVPGEGNIYSSFIADMNTLQQSGEINDWAAAPYDWRYTPEEIVSHGAQSGSDIFYGDATDTPYIIQELQQLAATSKTGKVTIIAHSEGGLVAKAMMQALGDTETSKLIDKVIFVAVPQVGTPSAIAGLLHGYGQGVNILGLSKLTDASAREVGDTLPGLYDLLPSLNYFTYVDDPVITFSGTPDWAARYGDPVHSVDRLDPFLSDATRMQPSSTDLSDPTTLNATYLAQAESTHQTLDAWTPPQGVQLIQITGWGMPTTLSGIDYIAAQKDAASAVTPDPIFTVDGDGTVVVPSALWVPAGADVQNYWLDLSGYNDAHWIKSIGGVNGLSPYDHETILQVDTVLNFINDQITDSVQALSNYPDLSTAAPASTGTRLRFALRAPSSIDVYDSAGDHTGISTTTGDVEENIPDSYYTAVTGAQYIFVDAETSVHIVMNSYATSTLTLDVDELDGNDDVVASTTFENVPTTPETIATINTDGSLDDTSALAVDENGDGTPDILLPSGGTVVYQPPATSTVPQTDQDTFSSTTASSSSSDTTSPPDDANGPPTPSTSDPDDGGTTSATTAASTSDDTTATSSTSVIDDATTTPITGTSSIAVSSHPKPSKKKPIISRPQPHPEQASSTRQRSDTLIAGAAEAFVRDHATTSSKITHQDPLLAVIKRLLRILFRFIP